MGKHKALAVSRICHVLAVALLGLGVSMMDSGALSWVGLAVVCGILIYEQSVVKPNDLSRVNLAFMTLNGFVSIGFFLFVMVDLWV